RSICYGLFHPRHLRPAGFPYTPLFRSVPRPKSASTPLVVPPTMTRTATQLSAVVTERPKGRCREIRTHSHTRATQMPSMVSQARSEEHTSELQSRENLVCRLLLETKNA